MKLILTIFILLVSIFSQAATRSSFFPNQALIIIQAINMNTGEMDSDPYDLYDLLNVPVVVGPSGDEGKIVESYDKKWNLICAERKATGTKQCQIIMRDGPHSKINMISKTAEFAIEGVDAADLFNQLTPQKSNYFEYTTSDQALKIIAEPDRFSFEYVNP